jgi:hypothetical protein
MGCIHWSFKKGKTGSIKSFRAHRTIERQGTAIIPDFAVGIVARRRKPKRNAQLEQFFDEGISIDMMRKKIVKQALQQGFASRSR